MSRAHTLSDSNLKNIQSLLTFSKKDLLLIDHFCAITYDAKLNRQPQTNVVLRAEIHCPQGVFNPFHIEPSVLTFDYHNFDKFQTLKVSVDFTTPLETLNHLAEEYTVIHTLISPEEPFQNYEKNLMLYTINTQAKHITACGKDDYSQLGLKESIYRFKAYRNYSTVTLKKPIKSNIPRFSNTQFLNLPAPPSFRSFDMGRQHSAAVDAQGALYIWGTGIYGQMGFSISEMASEQRLALDESIQVVKYDFDKPQVSKSEFLYNQDGFTPIVYLPLRVNLNFKVTSVACGDFHTIILDYNGNLHSMGLWQNGRLGHKNIQNNLSQAKLIDCPYRFVKVACTAHSSLALDVNGLVYSWGKDRDGVLGNPLEGDVFVPTRIETLQSLQAIFCGPVTCSCIDTDGKLFIWGRFNEETLSKPRKYTNFPIENVRIIKVALGKMHYGVLTDDFRVFTWGNNKYGQTGLGLAEDVTHVQHPHEILSLSKAGVCHITFGDYHSFAVNIQGLLYAWGRNHRSQLGIPGCTEENLSYFWKDEGQVKEKCVNFPKLVEDLIGAPVTHMLARYKSTMCLHVDRLHRPDQDEVLLRWKDAVLKKENKLLFAYGSIGKSPRSPGRSPKRDWSKSPKREETITERSPARLRREEEERGTGHEISKTKPLLFSLIGYEKSTVFENRSMFPKQEPVREVMNAMVILEKGTKLEGVKEEVLMHNSTNYPNVKIIFNDKVMRRANPLYEIMGGDEFDDVNVMIQENVQKNPYAFN